MSQNNIKELALESLQKVRPHLTHAEYAAIIKLIKKDTVADLSRPNEAASFDCFYISQTAFDDEVVKIAETEYETRTGKAAALSLDEADVDQLTVVLSKNEATVYALGAEAKSTLEAKGVEATYLPHPNAFKADPKRTAKKLDEIVNKTVVEEGESVSATIKKADDAKQIVYSVVLDPYQHDAHGDYISAAEIEQAAHNFLQKSRVIGFNHPIRS